MEKINLLKPDIRSGFFKEKPYQHYEYLQINGLNMESLKEDIRAGAEHFKDVLRAGELKPARVVVVKAANKEDGLMAISYLAGIYNEKEVGSKKYISIMEHDAYDSLDLSGIKGNDRGSKDSDNNTVEPGKTDTDTKAGILSTWIDNCNRIPILNIDELDGMFDYIPTGSDSLSLSCGSKTDTVPYWNESREQIIVCSDFAPDIIGNDIFAYSLYTVTKRLIYNRHVYVLLTERKYRRPEDYDESEAVFGSNSIIAEFVLDNTAECLIVSQKKNEEYYIRVFKEWINKYNFYLDKKFKCKYIVKRITDIRTLEKSDLIEKVIKLVTKNLDENTRLTEKDFTRILNRFGKMDSSHDEIIPNAVLEFNNLIGMKNAKEQIIQALDVLKFNMYRQQKGIVKQNHFSNVYVFLGAPGTAKTTMAKIMGELMRKEKLLKDGRFISISGAELKDKYVGHQRF